MEDFSLAVLHVFLEVIGCGFRDAEIFHGIGHLDTHLFTDSEEMVNGVAGSENNGRIIKDVDPVFPELFRWNSLYIDKFPENNVNIELFYQIIVRRFFKI
jgi:hypothetical protein